MFIRSHLRALTAAGLAGLTLSLAGCGKSSPASGGSEVAAEAGSGGLADGVYDCGGGYPFRAMGNMDIKAGQYRYRPFGAVEAPYAAYSVDAAGLIHWAGHMSGLDNPPAALVASTKTPSGFNVDYKGKPDGMTFTMSCGPMAGATPPA